MANTFDQLFAADPATPGNVAANASVLIFAPGDATKAPLTLTTTTGAPLANPVATNANGFGPAFMHATLDRVAWEGGGFTGFFTSYEGMKEEAVAARSAAESAAALVDAPADSIIESLVGNPATGTGAKLNTAFTAKKERARPVGVTKQLVAGGATHLGFPFAITAGDGNMIVAWRDGANHTPSKGVMRVARYSQSGIVLTAPTTVYTDATYDCRDAGLLLLADGRLALTFFVYNHTTETGVLDGCRVMFSSDHGVTWGAPVIIDSAFTTWAGSAGPLVQLANGDLLMPTYGVSSGQVFQHAAVSRSTDGGVTWAPLGVIANGDTQGGRHYQEPNIILTDKGDLLAVIRSDTTLTHFTSRSTDGGATWTTPVSTFPGNGAPRLTKQAGYIQCLHRHETTGRAVKISSGDHGATWSNQIVLPVFGAKVSSAYGVAMPYGKDSLRYIYSLQEGANNVSTADILMVDSIVPEDRTAPGPVGCRLRNSASVQVNTATWTSITFTIEDFDNGGLHSMTTNTGRISIPAGLEGYYNIFGTVYLAASTAVQVQARILKNGAALPGARDKKNPVSGQDAILTAVSGPFYLGAGDYLELQAYQDSGAAVSARTEDTVFSAVMVNAPV